MMQPFAEAIIPRQQGKKPVLLKLGAWARKNLTGSAAAFLMCYADIVGIPSGFYAAWITAVAVDGEPIRPAIYGCLLAYVMRIAWMLPMRWHMLLTLALLLASPALLRHEKSVRAMLWTGFVLLPGMAAAMLTGVTRDVIYAAATVMIGVLASPVMLRARRVLRAGEMIATVEEYAAIGYLAAVLLCGGARMLLWINIGAFGACGITLCAALALGACAGCMVGMVAGLVLALQGLPLLASVCLAMGGFLAGLVAVHEKRKLTCACFAAAAVLALYMADCAGVGYAAAAGSAAVCFAFLPEKYYATVQAFAQRCRSTAIDGDAYPATLLTRWERTFSRMIEAIPAPMHQTEKRPPAWWFEQLCNNCPETESCRCMLEDSAAARADEVLAQLASGAGEKALDGLRGLGCARLYHMRTGMGELCAQAMARERYARRACYERDMLLTHLTALSGAAKRFAGLSSGGTWRDDAQARALRQAAAELAMPATLLYARKVKGHMQVAWKLSETAEEQRLCGDVCILTGTVLQLPMEETDIEDSVLFLAEQPVYGADTGCASRGMLAEAGENGDNVYMRRLTDGRYLVALSDGMGHGAQASSESSRTIELLQLCISAGYTREQALTAVNGMMLAATQGERFATVDLMLLDLWTGDMTLDKLGAADSYLVHGEEITCLSGDALPLGVLEKIESRTCEGRLRDGDMLFLITDGVEEAFAEADTLHAAIRAASAAADAQGAAAMLLEAAYCAADGRVQDDQTVLAVRLTRNKLCG